MRPRQPQLRKMPLYMASDHHYRKRSEQDKVMPQDDGDGLIVNSMRFKIINQYAEQRGDHTGLAHRVCYEPNRTGTGLIHLSGYGRNCELQLLKTS